MTRRLLPFGLAVFTMAFSSLASGEQGAAGQAAAEALFQQGVDLTQAGNYADACEKFSGSQSLDPALGTLLRLADCYDHVGKTASAWALFEEAKALAEREHQADRRLIAAERAGDLEGRLSRVRFEVATQRASDVQITFNGVAVPRATWTTPLPVDPGPGRVEASAPGFETWHGEVEVPEGPSELAVRIPALVAEPDPASSRAASAQARGAQDRGPQSASSSGSRQRVIGFVLGGVGVASLVAGGVLALQARSLYEDSLGQCRPEDVRACTPRGVELRDDAKLHADMATVFMVAGGALASAGFVLVVAAPTGKARRSGLERVELRPGAASAAAGVTLKSAWW